MGMHVFKKYTTEDKQISDEFYSSDELVKEHLELSIKYLHITKDSRLATAFGLNNPYTRILSEMGFDVIDYNTFEDFLQDAPKDRILIDNPPFSTASKDRLVLEKYGFKYSLLASGTRFPKAHKYGAILFKQPRKYFTNRPEQVLCAIFHNFDTKIYSEYSKQKPNKYSRNFIAVNLNTGIYENEDIK